MIDGGKLDAPGERWLRALFRRKAFEIRPVVKKVIATFLNRFLAMNICRWVFLRTSRLKKIAFGEQYDYILFKIPTWLLVDHRRADIICDLENGQRVDLPDDSADIVYSSHMIEHLSHRALDFFLREAYRVLKTGAVLRIEAPDAEKLIGAYRNRDTILLGEFVDNGRMLAKKYNNKDYDSFHMAFLSSLVSYIEDGEIVPPIVRCEEVDTRVSDIESFSSWCVSLLTDAQKATHGHINPIYYSKIEGMLREAGFSRIHSVGCHETRATAEIRAAILEIERTHRAYYSFHVEAVK